jgi:AcrR family transcriptional regulator
MPVHDTTNPAVRSDGELRRRAAILDAARVELTKRGYDGVTMQGLANCAGVSRKTLYNQYGTKDELLLAAVSEIIEGYRSLGDGVEPGIPAILESRRRALRQIAEKPAYAEAMIRAVSQAPPDHPLVDLLFRQATSFVADQLRVAQTQGEISPDADPDEMAEQISAHAWGMSAYAAKNVIGLDRLESRSMRGLVILLVSIARGRSRRSLMRVLEGDDDSSERHH